MSTESWRRILVHIDPDGRAAERLQLAGAVAEDAQAQLAVAYACNPATAMIPLAEGAIMSERLPQLDATRRAEVRAVYDGWRAAGHEGSWEELVEFDLSHALTRRAMACDLAILGQTSLDAAGGGSVPAGLAADVLLHSGRPALVVPAVGDLPQRRVVVVAWKAAPQCVRAMTAALPLLGKAQRVVLVAFGGDIADCTAARAYLEAHGVRTELHREPEEPPAAGDMLLSLLADLGADLLVMGCYGRGRLQERVFGGMTRTVLGSMTVPVFMAN